MSLSITLLSNKRRHFDHFNCVLSVWNSNPEFASKMEEAANMLKVKGHRVGIFPHSRETIHGPGDIEGHVGQVSKITQTITFSTFSILTHVFPFPHQNKRMVDSIFW